MAKKIFNLTQDHINVITNLKIPFTKEDIDEHENQSINIFGGGYQLIEEIALIIYGRELEMNFSAFDTINHFNLTEEQTKYSEQILNELSTALRIVLQNKTFEIGKYTSKSYLDEWTKISK
jgi:hypothetical protein